MSKKFFHWSTSLILILALILITLSFQPARAAGPWYVSTTGDDNNDCLSPATPCATINGALANPGFVPGDTVRVAVGTYTGTGDQVVVIDKDATLSGGWDSGFTTLIGTSVIDGESTRRGIMVNSSITAIIENFTVQNGFVDSGFHPLGGGILNFGTLTLNRSIIKENKARGGGGGISNNSFLVDGQVTLILNDTVISNNEAIGSNGGGIRNGYNSTLILNRSTVSHNTADITNCGTEGSGGGIFISDDNTSMTILNNSTVSNNQACNSGGGIFSRGALTLNNSTISSNAVISPFENGGGISVENSVMMQNTIITNNTVTRDPFGRPDCDARFGSTSQTVIISLGYNLIGNSEGCIMTAAPGDLLNLAILFEPLQDNGGLTFTHALLPGSPAIDAGNPSGCTDQNGIPLTTDQRGVTRPQGTRCDIGAFEVEASGGGIEVSIDIKPGSSSNPINRTSTGKTPVAILSTLEFNAPSMVDRTSLTFGRTGDESSLLSCNKGGKDVNYDGLLDLVCHFKTQMTGFEIGDTQGFLKGQTLDETPLQGSDVVRIVK